MTAAATPMNGPVMEAAIDRSGWSHEIRWIQAHNPAWWLYWLLVIKGAFIYLTLASGYARYPSGMMLAILGETLYCLPWIWFLTRRDRYERQPAKLAVLAFLWGGLVATYVLSMPGNSANLSLMAKLIGPDFLNHWGPAFSAPIVEESTKLLGVVLIALMARNHVRNAYDGLLLGAFAGLGFQVFENVLYILNGAAASWGSNEVAGALQVLAARSAVGFWSHTLFSAIAGSGIGYFLGATDRSLAHRLSVAAGLFLLACVAHGCWDAALGFAGFALIGVITGTVAIILVWRFSERRQRDFVRVLLASDLADGSLSADELQAIAGRPKDRRAYLQQIRQSSGAAVARRAAQVLDAAIDLAAAIAATDDVHSVPAQAARSELSRVRALPAA